MNTSFSWLGAIAVVASVGSTSLHHNGFSRGPTPRVAPCTSDPNYQRLSFWVGDWEVVDSTGAHYAMQRVNAVIDACAITAEWTGGVGDKGMNLSSFDGRTGEWRQMYVSNQVPGPLGVSLRRSDPSYTGPGVRFIPLLEPAPGEPSRTRVTIMPLNDHRALQLFEESKDGGATWQVVFKAEHRPRTADR